MKKVTFKSILFLFSFILLSVASFSQKFDDPVDYNDYIIGEQFAIIEKMEIWSTSLSELAEKEVVMSYLNDMSEQIEESIKKVKKLKDYEGNTAFRDAAVELFEFYGRLCKDQYVELVDILYSEELGDEEIERMNEIIEKVSEEETGYDDKFIGAQKEFAEANDFELSTE
jgi:hypothetical protein